MLIRRIMIRHITDYQYSRSVHLNDHVLMLRPRQGRDIKVISHTLKVTPEAEFFYAEDVYGNEVVTAALSRNCERLTVQVETEVELCADPWPVYRIDLTAMQFPFEYNARDGVALNGWCRTAPATDDLRHWADQFVTEPSMDTLSLLQAINRGVHDHIRYEERNDEGTQSSIETLKRSIGSCRDLAVLFADAAKCLGFGTRLVSGYLVPEDCDVTGGSLAQTTHAWGEVYLPGAGWIAFDPTNQRMGQYNLIPVAVGQDMTELVPVSGTYDGRDGAVAHMSVSVTLRLKL